jgi:hypothetical protein
MDKELYESLAQAESEYLDPDLACPLGHDEAQEPQESEKLADGGQVKHF